MNKKYGKLYNGMIVNAPLTLTIDNEIHSRPTHQDYIKCGWKEIVNVYDDCTKEDSVFSHYMKTAETIEVHYVAKAAKTESMKISKLKLRIAIELLGLWDEVKTWMQTTQIQVNRNLSGDFENPVFVNLYELYQEAQIIDTEDPLFAPFMQEAKMLFANDMSDQQFYGILKECEA